MFGFCVCFLHFSDRCHRQHHHHHHHYRQQRCQCQRCTIYNIAPWHKFISKTLALATTNYLNDVRYIHTQRMQCIDLIRCSRRPTIQSNAKQRRVARWRANGRAKILDTQNNRYKNKTLQSIQFDAPIQWSSLVRVSYFIHSINACNENDNYMEFRFIDTQTNAIMLMSANVIKFGSGCWHSLVCSIFAIPSSLPRSNQDEPIKYFHDLP